MSAEAIAKAIYCEICRMIHSHRVKPCFLTPDTKLAQGILALFGALESTYKLEVKMIDEEGGFTLVTIFSLNKELLENLLSRLPVSHYDLGKLLGYPKCCVKRFVQDGDYMKAFRRYKKQCEEYSGDPFNIDVVVKLKGEPKRVYYYQAGRLSHIPCGPTCKKSGELALAYERLCARIECPLDRLKRLAPSPSAGAL